MSSSITTIIEKRGIVEVVHFTTHKGLLGCLATGTVLPRDQLTTEQLLEHILTPNAAQRKEQSPSFDKTENWINYVNLSISEVTTHYFNYSQRVHSGEELYWVILSFDPVMILDEGVYFTTTNNIYSGVVRHKGANGLEGLFAPHIDRWWNNRVQRKDRPMHVPTCEQAEVLYPGPVPLTTLRRVYVRQATEHDHVCTFLLEYGRSDVVVEINPAKFAGLPNGA